MAQIIEDNILIKISRITKDGENVPASFVTSEILETLESVTQELVDKGSVVEVIRA